MPLCSPPSADAPSPLHSPPPSSFRSVSPVSAHPHLLRCLLHHRPLRWCHQRGLSYCVRKGWRYGGIPTHRRVQGDPAREHSVVKVFTVSSSPNFFMPWQRKVQREIFGSGFAIPGRQIVTNAHVVADHTYALVRKHGSPTKYKAEVQAIGHEYDLALLTVENEEFWDGMIFLQLSDIPYIQEVAVVGYPQGGDNISVTKGVVSRVEPTQYVHGATQLMAIQIDAAINPGNSGGPAIMGDKVAGVAFQNLSGTLFLFQLSNTSFLEWKRRVNMWDFALLECHANLQKIVIFRVTSA
ncbi:protease Do-like 10, mitochondrial isoform X1 [Zingiber officinale]|uniref:protease Do-like 10, mitochondrial isoform X1 n=1 Tax=Zingiber officinale TaxID=94328 RepID=UPI001C4B4B84|nr:protease Do-like 10, mitochondrial isoform X1 [Zingiber officinale]XP_042419114.1 protease Do-like 10, mitochondrial isoform X1 [Zingiber officinale]